MTSEQQEPKQDPRIGAGHASAMLRQGLAELRGAVYPESNVAQAPQYGLYGTKTPGEVMQDRGAEGRDVDEVPSSLISERLERSSDREQETSGRDRE